MTAFNRPHRGVCFETVVAGLGLLADVTIQSMFAAGPLGNLSRQDVAAWLTAVEAIRPSAVQIYTIDRATPS